jgi:hypothetical protein
MKMCYKYLGAKSLLRCYVYKSMFFLCLKYWGSANTIVNFTMEVQKELNIKMYSCQ